MARSKADGSGEERWLRLPRASSIDGFIQRVRSIEDIAQQQRGVVDAYAIQAGREVRVIVEPTKVGDDEARQIAR